MLMGATCGTWAFWIATLWLVSLALSEEIWMSPSNEINGSGAGVRATGRYLTRKRSGQPLIISRGLQQDCKNGGKLEAVSTSDIVFLFT